VLERAPARHEFQSQAVSLYPAAEFPGAQHGAELEEYFRQAICSCCPHRRPGGAQAMSFGLPVIVAEGDAPGRSGAQREWLAHPAG